MAKKTTTMRQPKVVAKQRPPIQVPPQGSPFLRRGGKVSKKK